MQRGAPAEFVISIDLEMSWGAIHHGQPHDDSPYRREREIVGQLLELFEKYGISATWAVVGHLFLDACAPLGGRKHPEVIRPDYPWHPGDWFDLDPCSSIDSAPTWYGPDLIEVIRRSSTLQEIGSHSFSHLVAGEDGCSPEAFASDLAACRAVADDAELELTSFVYPRNKLGHLDVLAEAGFTAYRGPTPDRFATLPEWRRNVAAALDRIVPSRSVRISAQQRGSLTDVPQTFFFQPASTNARRLGTRLWSWQVRRRLDQAVRTGSLFHLWFHSHDVARAPDRAYAAMRALLAAARDHIDAGRLENLTMSQVAARMRGADDRAA